MKLIAACLQGLAKGDEGAVCAGNHGLGLSAVGLQPDDPDGRYFFRDPATHGGKHLEGHCERLRACGGGLAGKQELSESLDHWQQSELKRGQRLMSYGQGLGRPQGH
jgi:hypothetical protein